MAKEIIALERVNGRQQFAFYYDIPVGTRKEIGAPLDPTGTFPVLSPTSSLPPALLAVLTQQRKDALDLGLALVITVEFAVAGFTNGQILAAAQAAYADKMAEKLVWYEETYAYIGRMLDKE